MGRGFSGRSSDKVDPRLLADMILILGRRQLSLLFTRLVVES
jgi:hypothetical protein